MLLSPPNYPKETDCNGVVRVRVIVKEIGTLLSENHNRIGTRATAALLATMLFAAHGATAVLGQTYRTTPSYYYPTTPAQTYQYRPQTQYAYPNTYRATAYTYANQAATPAYTYANTATAYQSNYRTPAAAATTYAQSPTYAQPAATAASSGDPYGFLNWLNGVRAQYGLAAVGYDPNLASWAASNNAQQAARGLGHYVMGPARRQNAAVGDAGSIGSMWMSDAAHRAALLDPTITRIGLAGNGSYWTYNAN